jgi:hypothetical protein
VNKEELKTDSQGAEDRLHRPVLSLNARTKDECGEAQGEGSSEQTIELLKEGQECPFCHFARLKRDGDEVICPVCGYGHTSCT